ncbi:MAG: discoidin domain-containing protein [Imperialibacter sp.]|uniref:discoidin domain-containing protein n=1 Tax=Imperialibacter sp. TaxID=2038411 RepID=UPI0032EB2717
MPAMLIVLTFSLACCSDDIPESSPAGVDHPIVVRSIDGKAKFWNKETSSEYTLRGTNYFWIVPFDGGYQDRFFAEDEFDADRVRSDFRRLVTWGYNTVRIFLDTCNDGPGCIGRVTGSGLNPAYLDNVAETIQIASEEGIYLILTSNDLPDAGGYWEISNAGASETFEGYRNAHYLTPEGIESAQVYWTDLLKGVLSRESPLEHVLAWSILNEQWYFRFQPPFSLTSGVVTTANGHSYDMGVASHKKTMAVEGAAHYIEKVHEIIDKYDPNALVTMGFFAPDYPNPIGVGDFRYVETADLLTMANLDFFDFHAYPGEDSLEPLAENYGMLGFEAKPVIMGEFGAFIERYGDLEQAVRALQAWQAESCEYGYDGWLHWGMYQAPTGIGDATHGFMDRGMEMMEGLSPVKIPDPCDPELLFPENLALNKTVTVSRSISGEAPEMAVDGSYETQWGSGEHPPQWIAVDLGADVAITKVKMIVAQYPVGSTAHLLEARTSAGAWVTLTTFSGVTQEADPLEYTLPPGAAYRYVRITTTAGPSWVSWKEIEVYD